MKKLLVAALAIALLCGISAPASALTRPGPGDPSRTSDHLYLFNPVRIAYAGDSTTASPNAWKQYVDESAILPIGGHAFSGATSVDIAKGMPAVRASVLVVRVGNNDVYYRYSYRSVLKNIDTIVKKSGVKRVLVVAACPNNGWGRRTHQLAGNEALNLRLKQYAATRGFEYIDPDTDFRREGGGFVYGYTKDGTHPAAILSRIEADRIADKVHDMVGRGQQTSVG